MSAGVLEELKLVEGGRPSVGRPGKQVRLATGRPHFVVMDLGVEWTRFSALPAAPPEQERWQVQFKTPTTAEAWLERVGLTDAGGDLTDRSGMALPATMQRLLALLE